MRDLTNNGSTPDGASLDSVTVFLDTNGNGDLDGVEQSPVTGPNGSYKFPDLRPGRYAITEVQPTGYTDGKEVLGTVNGISGGRIYANDKFDQIDVLGRRSDTYSWNV